ncbi:hypothetical protein GCM10008967_13190 [Bacillus carboniphilus]|uniref:AB hydrolase-1 domain-containing protein n=1 Tax=Bacillus carboniphilus TaxID=86663 RepID=A0ABP3FV97_9BACI
MKKHTVMCQDTSIAVFEYSSLGSPIILLHPSGIFASYVWEKVAKELSVHYRVLAVDFRGHGESATPKSGYHLEQLALDIESVLDYFHIENAHIVGNSLGGEVAVVMASTIADRVQSITLIDGGILSYMGPRGEVEGTKAEIVDRFLHRKILEFDSIEDTHTFCMEQFPKHWGQWIPSFPIRTLPNGKVTYMQDGQITAQIMASVCDLDLDGCFNNIDCPVLFLPASKEPKLDIKLENISHWEKALQTSKLTIIPDSEHIMMTPTHSKKIAEEIHVFLSQIR